MITVTFKLDGGNIGGDPSNVTSTGRYGATLTKPADPTKPGYTFSSWQPVGDAPALSSTFPAKDAEYKPVWTANTYYVQFNRNGGSGDMSNQSFIYGRPQKLSKNQFTKTGYTFKGWARNLIDGKKYDDEQEVKNLTPGANTTVVLSAVWEENNYKVCFNGNGNDGGLMADQTFTYTEYKALSENKFTKTGHDFDGWAKTPGGNKEYNDKQPVEKLTSENNGTVNLYARWKIKVYTVRFNVDGGNGKIQVGSETPTTSGETQVTHDGSVIFTAKPDLGWEVDHWTGATANTPNTTATLSNVIASGINVKVKFKKITTVNAGDRAWKLLREVVRIADNNATITINGEIKATNDTGNWDKITLTGNITIRGDSSAVLNANGLSRIFNVPNGKTLTLENITLKNGKANNGGGVYNEGTLIMKGSATVAPSAGAGKNDVYLASGAMITVNSTLIPTDGIAAYITPGSYAEGQQVLNGNEFGSEYYKFEVTPESSTAEWVIKSDGCLKKAKDVVSSSSATPWKDLKTAITSAHDGDIIVINGEIKATDAPDNYGGITINKSITIKGKNKDTAILNANKNENGKSPHYIFFVNGGKTVTLQNLTLTGGINGKGGAIHIGASTHGSTVKMINCIIKDNAATGDGGGGVYIGSNGTFTMDGESSRITRNFVNGTGTGFAVYIDDEGTFNWIKGSISNNGGSDKAVHKEPDGEFNNPENYTAY
ncbi:InlB B-repeat-containing protein [Treponema vincentii]|nr:InlB B-repeat-containing protein [Treponema vincentii]